MKVELSISEDYLKIGDLLFKRQGYRFHHCMTFTHDMEVDQMTKEYIRQSKLVDKALSDENS